MPVQMTSAPLMSRRLRAPRRPPRRDPPSPRPWSRPMPPPPAPAWVPRPDAGARSSAVPLSRSNRWNRPISNRTGSRLPVRGAASGGRRAMISPASPAVQEGEGIGAQRLHPRRRAFPARRPGRFRRAPPRAYAPAGCRRSGPGRPAPGMPAPDPPAPPAGPTPGRSTSRPPPDASSSRQGRKFIGGEPVKPATNRLAGWL